MEIDHNFRSTPFDRKKARYGHLTQERRVLTELNDKIDNSPEARAKRVTRQEAQEARQRRDLRRQLRAIQRANREE